MKKKWLLKFWNFWPPFLFTGIQILYCSRDYHHIKAKLKLRFWNANYVGTQYGGSIFSLADPFYMVMLINNLGKNYIVWDKASTIRYLKPGKTDLYADFILKDEELESIIEEVREKGKSEWIKVIPILDAHNNTVAEITKTITIKAKPKS
ncbi:hypothetical protein BN1013_00665 [Candidatus Rubidus massiliensis]|nr:MAG: DUF4442 domain-containing protein [Chlamydia sp. 32-24]CDZ80159.1 hypothetical protein BN1013_00665 [Candidatus Rubidus massiliensis]